MKSSSRLPAERRRSSLTSPAGFEVRAETSHITSVAGERAGSQASQEVNTSALHGNSLDPKGFLLGVMNDKTVELHLRIEAAKALLPYFEGRGGSNANILS